MSGVESRKRCRRSSSRGTASDELATDTKNVKQPLVADLTVGEAAKRRRPTAAEQQQSTPAPVAPCATILMGSRVILLRCLFEGSEATIVGNDGHGGLECALKHNERVKIWVSPDDVEPVSEAGPSSSGATPPCSTTIPPLALLSGERRRSPRLLEISS